MRTSKTFLRIGLFVFITIACVYFYSPIGLDLSLFDEDQMMAAFGMINAVAILLLLIFGNKAINLFKSKPKKIVFPTTYTAQEVKDTLLLMQGSSLFQEITGAAIGQIEKSSITQKTLEKTISDSFQKGSLSWAKYHDIVSLAIHAIIENGMTIAKRLEQFDENEFFELRRIIQNGSYKQDAVPDDIQEGKLALYKKKLNLIYELININERLLIKLDSLDAELVSIGEKNVDYGTDLLSDINTLIEETKYYK